MERVSAAPLTDSGEGDLTITRAVIEAPLSVHRRALSGACVLLAGVVCILGWGFGARAGDSVFSFTAGGAAKAHLPNLHVPAQATAVLLGAVVVLLGLWQLVRGFSRSRMKWLLAVTLVCFVVSFLCWASSSAAGVPMDLLGLFQNTIFEAVPLILGALAGVLCERTGVINVAIEGQFLAGAFAGALAASVAGNLGVGLVAAMLAGGLIGALLAVFAIRYLVNQVILGVVLNVFALGLTGYGYDSFMQQNQSLNSPGHFGPIKVPLLGDIPVLGPLLFDANIIVYLTYGLVVVIDVALFRTRWGLRTRAVGEHPQAADTVGINVLRTRYRNVIVGGLVAGLGGAALTLGTVGSFSYNISSGKGFIALAALIFGRWSPRGAVGAALLFGFADALQVLLSVVHTPVAIPSNLLAMLPFLVTLFAVAGFVGRVRAPAADGEPYVKG
jgi:ABC-type uncharacterized transport system permease subunit